MVEAVTTARTTTSHWTQANDAGDTIPARPTYNSKIRGSAFTYNTMLHDCPSSTPLISMSSNPM
ncbi:hypothetical protein FQ922_24880 [Escherichia coli]|nr:hypothetical protein FQ922_24880 [Escherichia coli]